ncbi:hypothetical protein M422DRAFT_785457, partial [Sphaerobolus stellatus SS14]
MVSEKLEKSTTIASGTTPSITSSNVASVVKGSLLQRTQLALGFKRRYEFILWSIYSFVMTVFFVIRVPYWDPPTFQKASSPGEWHLFQKNPYYLGIFLHLFAALPAGFLSIFQLLPVIRSKYATLHRILGYAMMALLTLGNVGVILFSPASMGGNDLSLVAAMGTLIVLTSTSMFLGWYNMRYHQVEEHRKWMLRTISWMTIIITQRFMLFPLVFIALYVGNYYTLWSCQQILSVTGDVPAFGEQFPSCIHDMNGYAAVPVGLKSQLYLGSLVRLTFSTATWIAIVLHTFIMELYIHLTPKETERLRLVSYYRQRAIGLSPAGSAGITADRWGDSFRWTPPPKKVLEETGPADVNGVPR